MFKISPLHIWGGNERNANSLMSQATIIYFRRRYRLVFNYLLLL